MTTNLHILFRKDLPPDIQTKIVETALNLTLKDVGIYLSTSNSDNSLPGPLNDKNVIVAPSHTFIDLLLAGLPTNLTDNLTEENQSVRKNAAVARVDIRECYCLPPDINTIVIPPSGPEPKPAPQQPYDK